MESRVRGGGVRKEKIENIFMENYGDIIFIIILELYFVFPFYFCANPAIPKSCPIFLCITPNTLHELVIDHR